MLDQRPAPTPAMSAAPYAAPSVCSTVAVGKSNASVINCRQNGLRAPPPESRMRSARAPVWRTSASTSRREHVTPSTIARVRCARVVRVDIPTKVPRAFGSA